MQKTPRKYYRMEFKTLLRFPELSHSSVEIITGVIKTVC